MFNDISDHGVSDDLISFGTGGDGKSAGKAKKKAEQMMVSVDVEKHGRQSRTFRHFNFSLSFSFTVNSKREGIRWYN